jgi:hypothetical protein
MKRQAAIENSHLSRLANVPVLIPSRDPQQDPRPLGHYFGENDRTVLLFVRNFA